MYVVFIIDHIDLLLNESKMLTFAYNSDRNVYLFYGLVNGCSETLVKKSVLKKFVNRNFILKT